MAIGESVKPASLLPPGATSLPVKPVNPSSVPSGASPAPAGRRHLQQQRGPVLGRAAERPRVGDLVEAVEPAAAPPAWRRVPGGSQALRLGDHSVHLVAAKRQPGEPGPRTVSRQDSVRELVSGKRAVRSLAASSRPRLAEHELSQDRATRRVPVPGRTLSALALPGRTRCPGILPLRILSRRARVVTHEPLAASAGARLAPARRP